MTPSTFLGIRLPAEVKAALAGAAANAGRSMSWMVVMIVTGWLRENGYLPPRGKPAETVADHKLV